MSDTARCLRVLLLLAAGVLAGTPGSTDGKEPSVGDLPVQHEGRIKPLDTFARVHLLAAHGKRSLPDLSAIDWLLELTVNPVAAGDRPVFTLRNPAMVAALDLPERERRRYTHDELAIALGKKEDWLRELYEREDTDRSLVETQLVELYLATLRHRQLSRSLSCLLPDFRVDDPEIASTLTVNPGEPVSYYRITRQGRELTQLLAPLSERPQAQWSDTDRALDALVHQLNDRRQDHFATAMRIVPAEEGEEWSAPWFLMGKSELSAREEEVLDLWESLLAARISGDAVGESVAVERMVKVLEADPATMPSTSNLQLESWYNRVDLFYKSVAFYILAFLLLAVSWMGKGRLLRRLALISLVGGLAFHTAGLWIRMVIMGRPPVSTLYESIVFVGFVAVLMGVIVEWGRRDGMGVFVASVVGAVLHFLGFGYAADGDTLGMLVAVLNSNFWLATHVVTITIGYGCSIVAGLAGHVYLVWQAFRSRERARLAEIHRNMMGLTLVALFFTLFGTILGGIWADQSWGRFWGWDPKENGALLIVLWQLMLLHGRSAELFRPTAFAAGLVLNNLIVALAWFGVNLLNVGLHTYGYTSHIAINLAIFCGLELLFVSAVYPFARHREAKEPKAPGTPFPGRQAAG
jgi:ABC-type transport system involved in cytochrome c biogenesis permease subunit